MEVFIMIPSTAVFTLLK